MVADELSHSPDLGLLLDVFCLPLSALQLSNPNPSSPFLSLSNLTTVSSNTLADIVKAQEQDPFCVQMLALLHSSTNQSDPIHS